MAQHSGLPTRLLDWSERAYIAAYFAAREAADKNIKLKKKDTDRDDLIVVWALNTKNLKKKFKDVKEKPVKILRPTMGTNPCLAAQRGVLTLLQNSKPIGLDELFGNREFMRAQCFPLWRVRHFTHRREDFGLTTFKNLRI